MKKITFVLLAMLVIAVAGMAGCIDKGGIDLPKLTEIESYKPTKLPEGVREVKCEITPAGYGSKYGEPDIERMMMVDYESSIIEKPFNMISLTVIEYKSEEAARQEFEKYEKYVSERVKRMKINSLMDDL